VKFVCLVGFVIKRFWMWLLNVVKIVTVGSDIDGCQNGAVCGESITHIWLAHCFAG